MPQENLVFLVFFEIGHARIEPSLEGCALLPNNANGHGLLCGAALARSRQELGRILEKRELPAACCPHVLQRRGSCMLGEERDERPKVGRHA